MSDLRRYSISILENYSNKSLHEIALVVTESVFCIKPDEFILEQTKNLALGTEFLYTEELITWREAEKELAPAFKDFPDTCFCVFVSDGEDGGQYRTLFFNGKAVTQYPEIRYPDFHLNDFEYQSSDKTPLGSAEKIAEELISKTCNKIAASMTEEHDPELLGLIRQNLFGDITMINP
jgi:hypothetical protein